MLQGEYYRLGGTIVKKGPRAEVPTAGTKERKRGDS